LDAPLESERELELTLQLRAQTERRHPSLTNEAAGVRRTRQRGRPLAATLSSKRASGQPETTYNWLPISARAGHCGLVCARVERCERGRLCALCLGESSGRPAASCSLQLLTRRTQ